MATIMNYTTIYTDFVLSRKNSPPSAYVEKHHIIPRSLGGSDDESNIIALSPRDHFFAHRLLAKIHGGKMWAALAYMSRGNVKSAKGVRITSRIYDLAKRKDSEWRSDHYTKHNPWRGKKFSPAQLSKMRGPRPSIAGENHPFYGTKRPDTGVVIAFVKRYASSRAVKPCLAMANRIDKICDLRASDGYTDEMRKLAMYFRGAHLGESRKGKMYGSKNPNYGNGAAIAGSKNPMYGKQQSDDTKRKISEKAKRTVSCPKCGKMGSISNMKRWHFDNCRHYSAN